MKEHMVQALISTPNFKDIRAKLREAMFQILSQRDQYQTTNFFVKNFLSTDDGYLVGGIVKDYLECMNLNYTLNVFTTEAGGISKVHSRETIEKILGKKCEDGVPVLVSLLQKDNSIPSPKGKMPNLSIPSFKPRNNLLDLLERPKASPGEKSCTSSNEIFDEEDIDFQELLQVPDSESSEEISPMPRKKSL